MLMATEPNRPKTNPSAMDHNGSSTVSRSSSVSTGWLGAAVGAPVAARRRFTEGGSTKTKAAGSSSLLIAAQAHFNNCAAAAAFAATAAPNAARAELSPSTNWNLWPALPLAPYGKRKTLMREAVPGKVWTFDQLFGVFYVHVPIRMTVIAMESGGLFVYAPVAPTKECIALFQPLVD